MASPRQAGGTGGWLARHCVLGCACLASPGGSRLKPLASRVAVALQRGCPVLPGTHVAECGWETMAHSPPPFPPPNWQEKTLRVYSRNACPKHVKAVHEAFECWLRSRFGSKVTTSTPSKPPLPRVPQVLGAAASRLAPGVGSKRARGLDYAAGSAADGGSDPAHDGFGGAAEDDSASPTCLMRAKQARQ